MIETPGRKRSELDRSVSRMHGCLFSRGRAGGAKPWQGKDPDCKSRANNSTNNNKPVAEASAAQELFQRARLPRYPAVRLPSH